MSEQLGERDISGQNVRTQLGQTLDHCLRGGSVTFDCASHHGLVKYRITYLGKGFDVATHPRKTYPVKTARAFWPHITKQGADFYLTRKGDEVFKFTAQQVKGKQWKRNR